MKVTGCSRDMYCGTDCGCGSARRSSLQLLQLEGQKVPTAEGAEFMSVCVDILENAKARRDTNEELHAPLAPRVLQTDSQRDRTFLTNCRSVNHLNQIALDLPVVAL